MVNVIWLLIRFIAQINEKDIRIYKIGTFNSICAIIVVVIMAAWVFNLQDFAGFLAKGLPWCK